MIAKTSERAVAAGPSPVAKQDVASFSADDLFALARKDRKSTRLNSSHIQKSRMPSSA